MYKVLIRISEYDGKRVLIREKKRPVVYRIPLQDLGLAGLAMQGCPDEEKWHNSK